VYAFPIFPLEIITAVVALSGRSLKRFIWIPIIALPVDAFIVVFFGSTLHTILGPLFDYISILVVLAILYALFYLFYKWKREEIKSAGKRVEAVAKQSVAGVERGVKTSVRGVEKATAAVAREVKKIGKNKR
jgi:prepilin signal peptidase PulO-like enzyme (type II secretory pathway)